MFYTFSVNFHINFFTKYAVGVAFTFSVQEEVLTVGGQVSLSFLILVVVYLLIGFEVRVLERRVGVGREV